MKRMCIAITVCVLILCWFSVMEAAESVISYQYDKLGRIVAITSDADPLGICTSCHADKSALLKCRSTKWVLHSRKNLVAPDIIKLAERTYTGTTCTTITPWQTKVTTRKP